VQQSPPGDWRTWLLCPVPRTTLVGGLSPPDAPRSHGGLTASTPLSPSIITSRASAAVGAANAARVRPCFSISPAWHPRLCPVHFTVEPPIRRRLGHPLPRLLLPFSPYRDQDWDREEHTVEASIEADGGKRRARSHAGLFCFISFLSPRVAAGPATANRAASRAECARVTALAANGFTGRGRIDLPIYTRRGRWNTSRKSDGHPQKSKIDHRCCSDKRSSQSSSTP